MKISVISFTDPGRQLAVRIREELPEWETELYQKPGKGLTAWAGEQFEEGNALVFIGACGIAVRAVAPFVKDKLTDNPVLVLDEKGQYVIPILSGHVGGANELAEILAKRLKATAVITTATDIREAFAVDLFARKNHFTILNKEGIAKVSAKVLRGEKITVSIEGYGKSFDFAKACGQELPKEVSWMAYPPEKEVDVAVSTERSIQEKAVLKLKPKKYVLGIGCKKGKSQEEIGRYILFCLEKLGIAVSDIEAMASIDRKKEEPGLCAWARKNKIPFLTFSGEELKRVEGNFKSSGFVAQTVGVDNVCERAAVAACKGEGILVLEKQADNGITLAVAKKRKITVDWRV